MSMKVWSECGYGYKLYNKKNIGKIVEFMKKHANQGNCKNYEDLQAYEISDSSDVYDIAEDLETICNEPVETWISEIIGEETSDDIINEVFARFCLGK